LGILLNEKRKKEKQFISRIKLAERLNACFFERIRLKLFVNDGLVVQIPFQCHGMTPDNYPKYPGIPVFEFQVLCLGCLIN
jgi:hypothetical protein